MTDEGFEPLTDEQVAQIPREWAFGQVGPYDKLHRCRECKKLVAIDTRVETIVRVGATEFEFA